MPAMSGRPEGPRWPLTAYVAYSFASPFLKSSVVLYAFADVITFGSTGVTSRSLTHAVRSSIAAAAEITFEYIFFIIIVRFKRSDSHRIKMYVALDSNCY